MRRGSPSAREEVRESLHFLFFFSCCLLWLLQPCSTSRRCRLPLHISDAAICRASRYIHLFTSSSLCCHTIYIYIYLRVSRAYPTAVAALSYFILHQLLFRASFRILSSSSLILSLHSLLLNTQGVEWSRGPVASLFLFCFCFLYKSFSFLLLR